MARSQHQTPAEAQVWKRGTLHHLPAHRTANCSMVRQLAAHRIAAAVRAHMPQMCSSKNKVRRSAAKNTTAWRGRQTSLSRHVPPTCGNCANEPFSRSLKLERQAKTNTATISISSKLHFFGVESDSPRWPPCAYGGVPGAVTACELSIPSINSACSGRAAWTNFTRFLMCWSMHFHDDWACRWHQPSCGTMAMRRIEYREEPQAVNNPSHCAHG